MPWLLLLTLTAGPADLPVVVIDPGHGGTHDGAVGVCGAKEKEIALAISLELGKMLEASGRAEVVYTRTTDVHVELEARGQIANGQQAAFFLSIHANASTRTKTRGIETYFLSRHGADRRASELVSRENEGRTIATAVPEDDLSLILQGLSLQASHVESQQLALSLQESLNGLMEAGGRGVLQEPFIVLLEARVPAALVEVGFLTNQEECLLLANIAYQRKLARALMIAIITHLSRRSPVIAQR